MSVSVVLDQIRDRATSEHDKGTRFERMVRSALRMDRTYRERFTDVWMWSDWPGRGTEPDIGIDLVAKTPDGSYIAIQCKCYAPDHTLTKPEVDSFFSASSRAPFTERIIVATTDLWSPNAERALERQDRPVTRIGIDELDAMTVDWSTFDPDRPADLVEVPRHNLRPHQEIAVEKVLAGLTTEDRGQLIMACGTGKTFTSLRIAEHQIGVGGTVLFLAPSIALVSQTLKEWTAQTRLPMRPFAVCSDTTVARAVDGEIGTPYDLAVPPTTDAEALAAAGVATPDGQSLTVVFSTYQSLPVVAEMQAETGLVFDLVVCDEAHRTAGTTSKEEEGSAFVLVHDDAVVPARKRLYMTATPKVYKPAVKIDAADAEVVVASMDDPAVFGTELHRLGFGEAVTRGLLADYRVLILTVGEEAISEAFQGLLSRDGDLNLPDVAKIVGCLAGLSKRRRQGGAFVVDDDPMRRAVAFWSTIAESTRFAEQFELVAAHYQAEDGPGEIRGHPLVVPTRHVDGTTNIRARRADIRWLEQEPADDECRVLTNAKCLTEGVDVPALDAVMFLKPKRSTIDIVQAVGRVMRKPPGKEIGYIILPVVVPAGQSPEQALDANPDYEVVWSVLQALRSHDERFNSYINRIQYLSDPPQDDPENPIEIVDVSSTADEVGEEDGSLEPQLPGTFAWEEWTGAIYARMVKKVGTRTYWEDWAADVVDIARRHHARITAILKAEPAAAKTFNSFIAGLHQNLNDAITTDDAIAMVSQHLITRPIFEALFGDDAFVLNNPVAHAMQEIADVLDTHNLDTETSTLDRFYDSVRMRVEGIPPEDGAARQRIVKDLYGRFFKLAFPADAESLGIVYTPIEVVDFILRASEAVLREHFDGASVSDEGVHVLDPFTGTGTFITRLLQSGLIRPEDLARKYAEEIHANEILLLAYYIAAVNIETTYRQVAGKRNHQPFRGIVLTDTFQLGEGSEGGALEVFPVNNQRATRQKALNIRVVRGNPPYSAGQSSANDNNANLTYPALDESIRTTYASRSTATRKGSLYDSYIRAIRWASRRVIDGPEGGVVAYVTNGGFIDSNTADGLRLMLGDEFHHIYVYNLRGNARTAGERRRREAGNVFGHGSKTTVAITLLIRLPGGPPSDSAAVHYRDIGDYLSRFDKLQIVDAGLRSDEFGNAPLDSLGWRRITPNAEGDWINQRSEIFSTLLPVHDDAEPSIFRLRTNGLKSNRDAWNYNASHAELESNTRRMIDHYNTQVDSFAGAHPNSGGTQKERVSAAKQVVDLDSRSFSWDHTDFVRLVGGVRHNVRDARMMSATYRPFTSRYVNAEGQHNSRVYRLGRVFPTEKAENVAIGILAPGASAPFTVLMVDRLPDNKLVGAGNAVQFMPRWTYETDAGNAKPTLLDTAVQADVPVDNITTQSLNRFLSIDPEIAKDDVFFYVYGLLHSPDCREAFAADLKRSLPRIRLPDSAEQFWAFVHAGRELGHLHTEFEQVPVWPDLDIRIADQADLDDPATYRVTKMKYAKRPTQDDPRRKVDDPTTIVFNDLITIANIPERAHDYRLAARSAIDWVVDQQRVKTDKKSGITNDPNDWAIEHDNPRYILDLVGRVVTVSMRTLDIIDGLPSLNLAG